MKNNFSALCSRVQRLSLLLLFVGWFHGTLASAQVTLQGTLTHSDHDHYREVAFTVPEDVHRLTVDFSYTGREQGAIVDLGLWDPQRFRGWSGGNKSGFTISEADATPSYLPGTIIPGRWVLELGVPNLPEGVEAHFTATIQFNERVVEARIASKAGPRWYRGDLHMHDAHSDGSCKSQEGIKVPCPLFQTVEAAATRKLDFIAVTDHNTTAHFDALRELAPYFDDLLLMHGREITTFQGHANVYGTDQFIDFRVGTAEAPDMNAVLKQVRNAGGLFSINHPSRQSGPKCTGCGWTPHPAADMSQVQAIEAVNSIDANSPVSGVPFWEQQLNEGFHITGIGGSDNHGPDTYPPPGPGSIGYPTTVVFAEELSEKAILQGIRAGHVFVDIEGTRDRQLTITAKSPHGTASMGDTLQTSNHETVTVVFHVEQVEGQTLEIVEDGHPNAKNGVPIDSSNFTHTITVKADGRGHWIRANVRSEDGKLLLLGNPIYLVPRRN